LLQVVTAVDPQTGEVVDVFEATAPPRNATVSPDGARLYIANTGWTLGISSTGKVDPDAPRGSVSAYNLDAGDSGSAAGAFADGPTSARRLVGTVAVGLHPFDIAVSPKGAHAYVSNLGSAEISVLDTEALSVVDILPVAPGPLGIALDADGSSLYVVSYFSSTVSRIDTSTGAIVQEVPVQVGPRDVAVASDGAVIVVSDDPGAYGAVSVLEPQTLEVRHRTPIGDVPYKVTIGAGQTAFVAARMRPSVAVLDITSGALLASVDTSETLGDIAIAEDGLSLFTLGFSRGVVGRTSAAMGTWTNLADRSEAWRIVRARAAQRERAM
jgi:YVTN family beta-propeller protein